MSLPLFACILVTAAAGAPSYEAIESLPGMVPVRVVVNGNPRSYFRITTTTPLAFTVEGPTRVRITTRAEWPSDAGGVVTYQLIASERGGGLDTLDTETSPASGVKLAGGRGAIGKSRHMLLKLPAGSHRLVLSLAGHPSVLVRLHTGAQKSVQRMVSLTPVAAEQSVDLTEGEKVIPYYTIADGHPVRFRVVGPTTLELATRLDFDSTMRGSQRYRLRLREGTRVIREFELRTTKALGATYTQRPERVPSKMDVTRVPIADGVHEITVELLQPARGGAQVHARIPEPSVGNEE